MKDSQTSANIKFLKREDPPAPDGSRLAETRWVYDVDGQPVWVVTDKYLMHDWEVTELQIIEAGRACIRDKIDNEEWSPSPQSNRMALDQTIAPRLGWKRRHGQSD